MRISASYDSFKRSPLLFVWSTLIYFFLNGVVAFAGIGILSLYFLFLSFIGAIDYFFSPLSLGIVAVILIFYIFFSSGFKAGLMKGYMNASENKKFSLTEFYSYSFDRAPTMFLLELFKSVLLVLLGAPVVALHYFFLSSFSYGIFLTSLLLFVLYFVLCFVLSPAFIWAGAYGSNFASSLRRVLVVFKRSAIPYTSYYILLWVLFALSLLPLLNLVIIFVALPVVLLTLIKLVR